VNAHTHLIYSDFHEMATLDLPFAEWIGQFPLRRAEFTDVMFQASTRRGIHAALTTGTTSVADIAEPNSLLALARSGLGGVSYLEVVAATNKTWEAKGRARLASALASAPSGRAIGISPHTLYTVDTDVWHELVSLAHTQGLRLHPHLAESAQEVQYVLDGGGPFPQMSADFGLHYQLATEGGSGLSPTALMHQLGALGPTSHVAHGVHCDATDRVLLRDTGTAVALCVRSNAVLGAGEPPIAAYLAEGNPIALGTDSLASCPSLDLLEEAQAARALARAQGYTGDDLDRRLVEAATIGGAQAMALTDIGGLAAGYRADLAIFNVPTDGDPHQALIDNPGHCVGTITRGKIVHRRLR